MKLRAQLTVTRPGVAGVVLRLPFKILVVGGVVVVEVIEIFYESLDVGEVQDVDDGVRGSDGGVVSEPEHHRHHVMSEDLEELLRHVVSTEGVLEGEVELVVFVQQGVTLRRPLLTLQLPTMPVHVYLHKFLHVVHHILSAGLGGAV